MQQLYNTKAKDVQSESEELEGEVNDGVIEGLLVCRMDLKGQYPSFD